MFSLSEESEKILNRNKSIELSKTKQFGWYYGKIHKSEIQVYSATNPKKFNHLTDFNPELIIDSLDKYYDVKLKKDRLKILKKYKRLVFYKLNLKNLKPLEDNFKKNKYN